MKNIDYSTSFRIPVDVSFTIDGLSVSANGVSIYFKGEVFSLVSDTKCDIDLSFDDTLRVYLKPHSDGIIREYYYFDGIWSGYDEITVAETKLSGIGVFIRRGDVSFFLSLDFPYSVINHEGSRITIGCDPLDMITKENIYTPHTLTIGACRLTGTMSGKYDLGEIEGFSEYILSRMPVNFRGERPITITTCITNRMTNVRDGRIFYSMY
ncbi:MAG: hypothetical protein GX633_07565, partial [Clostridiales bacterium]|nr:hypothetical protein [Clostridiales bacterium]